MLLALDAFRDLDVIQGKPEEERYMEQLEEHTAPRGLGLKTQKGLYGLLQAG
jgi:hypothetical protein